MNAQTVSLDRGLGSSWDCRRLLMVLVRGKSELFLPQSAFLGVLVIAPSIGKHPQQFVWKRFAILQIYLYDLKLGLRSYFVNEFMCRVLVKSS